jgi:hypothetical protein
MLQRSKTNANSAPEFLNTFLTASGRSYTMRLSGPALHNTYAESPHDGAVWNPLGARQQQCFSAS